ncbi:MAG: metallophosphoesterase family protein [Deltaproteobacteria bacterium]|nr:metallophosphoesterase family protein [Deltaproteobacteria bacterium]
MADSHGEPDKIAAALDFLFEKGCDRLYHLGDICDSAHPGTAEACVRPLLESGILAIKGNNDHQIEVNHRSRGANPGHRKDLIPRDVLEFIIELPLVRSCQHALFTHSLPFARELGLSSMVGTMGEMELNWFFSAHPRGMLFRGHSHDPELIFKQDHRIITRVLQPGRKYNLSDQLPAVVTCGALTNRFCMIWMPETETLECHKFNT